MTAPETSLAGYVLEERIAVGGMAEIFRARRQGPQGFAKRVAVKRVLPDLARDPSFVAMFLDEARLAARLSSANLVQVFDFGCEEGAYFMVMEYVDGLDLSALLAKVGRLPPKIAMFVTLELGRGLEHLHGAVGEDGERLHIVHRDVTPANVLLSRTGEVKLGDFGVAKVRARTLRTARGAIKGKLAYLSPEQARGEELDARSDLYALGLTLFEALTGERFLDARDELALLKLAERPIWRPAASRCPGLPPALDHVLGRILAAEPERRFPSVRLATAALADAVPLGDAGAIREALAALVSAASTSGAALAPAVTAREPGAASAAPAPTPTPSPPRTEVLSAAPSMRTRSGRRSRLVVLTLAALALAGALLLWPSADSSTTTSDSEQSATAASAALPTPEVTSTAGPVSSTGVGAVASQPTPGPAPVAPMAQKPTPPSGKGSASSVHRSAHADSTAPIGSATSSSAQPDAPMADDAAPVPPAPERQRVSLAAVDGALVSRHLLLADVPALAARRAALATLIERGEMPVAELEALEQDIGKVSIDRAFIDAKLFRLNKAMAGRPLDEVTKRSLGQRAQAALSSSLKGRYDVANQELNAIAAVVEP